MTFDLLASIEMTACAAVAIAVVAIGFGETVSTRIRIATGLSVWFMLVTLMTTTECCTTSTGSACRASESR